MRKGNIILYAITVGFLLAGIDVFSQVKYLGVAEKPKGTESSNKLSNKVMPVIGVWVWNDMEMLPNGYKAALDKAGSNSPFNLIVPFLRFPTIEVVDPVMHDQVKLAAEYATQQGLALVPDLDIRSARRAFQKVHPDELQQMLRVKEIALNAADSVDVVIPSLDLNDHYSGGRIPHHMAISGALLRTYAYQNTADGIEEKTIMDITTGCRVVFALKDSVKVRIPSASHTSEGQTHVSVMVAFTHLYPDIFAPHIMEFQRNIIRQYADVKVAGVCKDEWGFPPYYPRFYRQGYSDYWYSGHRAEKYSDETGGRELLSDCLLMSSQIKGKNNERQMVINHFMSMSTHRNTELETDFYCTTKEVFGPDAAVTVHSTWWPYPDKCEFMKNGLDWWTNKRDWAQTDEVAPYAVRTALCKKWGSAIWYNMYYKADLGIQMWSSALAGGRIDYLSYFSLYDNKMMQGENRIRLMNFICKSPLDCRVAVIFGHACAMNWAGPHYDDVGMAITDSLWHNGYPADLIPTTEITNQSLRVDAEGYIVYGSQRYSAVVLYHPEFENQTTADFFNKVAKGKTALYRVGNWTGNFEGKALDGNKLLPQFMVASENDQEILVNLLFELKKRNTMSITPATSIIDNKFFGLRDFTHASYAPATTGFSYLIDGTRIQVAGTHDFGGDTIQSVFDLKNRKVMVDAIGVVAVRLDDRGNLEALAAGGLKYFKVKNFEIKLAERQDMALWKDSEGRWQGVVQGDNKVIPDALKKITGNWTYLMAPEPEKLRLDRL